MFSNYLSSAEGVAIYPLISLFIFVPFFIAVTFWIFKLDKKFLNHMSELPLDDSQEQLEHRNESL